MMYKNYIYVLVFFSDLLFFLKFQSPTKVDEMIYPTQTCPAIGTLQSLKLFCCLSAKIVENH